MKVKTKFTVFYVVRYSFDTQEEADNFAKSLDDRTDGYFVTSLKEVNDEQE